MIISVKCIFRPYLNIQNENKYIYVGTCSVFTLFINAHR